MLTIHLKPAFRLLLLSTAILTTPFTSNASNMHDAWNTLVINNVKPINEGHSTAIDYNAMLQQHKELRSYLKSLSDIKQSEFNQWNKSKQLAFLINAYNAWTIELILTKYPELQSIKDLGSFFSSPWSNKFIPLLGETRSLDNIEHELIRGAVDASGNAKYNEPRIHFAVNCASIGCPALREEAYTSEKLDEQLEQQTLRFLSDTSRNVANGNTLNISSIFKWYGEDFEKGFKGSKSLNDFLLLYPNAFVLSPSQQKLVNDDKIKIKFLDYNWDLNAQH